MVSRAGSDLERWPGGCRSWAARAEWSGTRREDALSRPDPGKTLRVPRASPLSTPTLEPKLGAGAALEMHPALGATGRVGAAARTVPAGQERTAGAGRRRDPSATPEKVLESWRTPAAGRAASRFAAPERRVRTCARHSLELCVRGRAARKLQGLGSQWLGGLEGAPLTCSVNRPHSVFLPPPHFRRESLAQLSRQCLET